MRPLPEALADQTRLWQAEGILLQLCWPNLWGRTLRDPLRTLREGARNSGSARQACGEGAGKCRIRLIYKIVEISTAKASGHTYVLVNFWRAKTAFNAAKPPDRVNDFLMQLRPTGVRVVTNAEGWPKRKDGVFVDLATLDPEKPQPGWERETIARDLSAEIKANIEAYWARAEAKDYPSDHSTPTIERDSSDPHGVLARPDVMALKDSKVEKP